MFYTNTFYDSDYKLKKNHNFVLNFPLFHLDTLNFLGTKNHTGQLYGRVKHLCNDMSHALLNNFEHYSGIVNMHKMIILA
jgi:hypothetical protein